MTFTSCSAGSTSRAACHPVERPLGDAPGLPQRARRRRTGDQPTALLRGLSFALVLSLPFWIPVGFAAWFWVAT